VADRRQFFAAALVGTGVIGTLAAALLLGFSPLATGILVVAAFAGGSLVTRGLNLMRGLELVAAKQPAPLSWPEMTVLAREQAATFARLAPGIVDPELRRRIGHVGERLNAVVTQVERRPDLLDNISELRTFVQDYLPRALRLIERYVELTRNPRADGGAQIAALVRTLNQIADQVKVLHDRLVSHEVAEFEDANRSLQTELELDGAPRPVAPRKMETP
jgi:hypothetical protein